MSVRLRITILFASIVLIILILVCGSVYYFSYSNRLYTIKTRLGNWAITTGKLLSQSGVFNQKMIMRIDASTILAMKDKTVQAYNPQDYRLYKYSDDLADTIRFQKEILEEARAGNDVYFTMGNREGIAHHYSDANFNVVMVAAAFDEEGKRKLVQLQYILLFSLAGGIIIAVGAGFFFSKRLLIPLRKIADEVNEISVQNLGGRIKSGSGKDEWNYLSETLNQLLNRLEESIEIHRRFISNASHELSTPLTSISSQLEVSLNRERDAADYRQVMQSIYQDVRQLSKLTQTLLEFARASGDPGGIEIDLVRIDEVLLALPAELTKLNKDYIVSLVFDELPEEEDRLLVFGNQELLFTAVKNLVINGCKYSKNHQTCVRLSTKENVILIQVQDEGIGMDSRELENIFLPFYRVKDSQKVRGFGLGLSLSKQIIQLHKGSIIVNSVPGNGTTFSVSFPSAFTLLKKKSHR
jgi:two-component system, OmpR family, sensor histidine kinase ArlS